jgi:hypothetical protein
LKLKILSPSQSLAPASLIVPKSLTFRRGG